MSLLSVIAGPAVPSHIYKWHYENLAASISRIVKARDDIYHTKNPSVEEDKDEDKDGKNRCCYFDDCRLHKQELNKIKSWYATYPDDYINTAARDFPWLRKLVILQGPVDSYINEFIEGMMFFRGALFKKWTSSIGLEL